MMEMPAGLDGKTVSPALIDVFVRRAERYGIDAPRFMQMVGLAEPDRHARLPGDKYLRLLDVANRLPFSLDDLPRSLEDIYPAYPELTAYLCHSPSAREGVVRYLRHRCLIGELDEIEVVHLPASLRLCYRNEAGMARRCSCALANFALVLCTLRHLLGTSMLAVRIELQGELAIDAARLSAALGARVRYGAKENRLFCRSQALDAPVAGYQPLLASHLARPVERLCAALRHRGRWAARIERMLQVLLSSGHGAGEQQIMLSLCGRMGISRWTLQRRLRAEQTSFSTLWHRARLVEADRLLAETGWPIALIASRLGFASASAFSRFFLAGRAMSPSRFRHSARQR